jgi:hypothetical protein
MDEEVSSPPRTYRHAVSDDDLPANILERLDQLISQRELQAAHQWEMIPDGIRVGRSVDAALRAAVASGLLLGLELARDLIVELRDEAKE